MELLLDRLPFRTADAVMELVPGAGSMLASFRVRSGMIGSAAVPVRLAQSIIGSDPASDIVLSGDGVAARHGQLRLLDGVWTLIDFGSPAGSVVDGLSVRGEALLAPGSAVKIGGVELAFAPEDRWEDSPHERRSEERAPLLLLPPDKQSFWPALTGVLLICGLVAAAFFLLRNH